MKYSKPALTREQQADLLMSRGMIGDRDHIVSQLSAVNYYRLLPAHGFSPNIMFQRIFRFGNAEARRSQSFFRLYFLCALSACAFQSPDT